MLLLLLPYLLPVISPLIVLMVAEKRKKKPVVCLLLWPGACLLFLGTRYFPVISVCYFDVICWLLFFSNKSVIYLLNVNFGLFPCYFSRDYNGTT